MRSYKIRVNNESESKEVQELFFELGGSWGGVKKIQGWDDIRQLYLQNGHITYSDDIDYFNNDPLEEITITKLRDLVVLKRNCVGDATHIDRDGEPWFASSDNKFHSWADDHWAQERENVVSNYNPKPIEKEMKMKEYLDKDYVLRSVKQTAGDNQVPDGWIEVPEGADVAAKSELNNGVVFYKDNGLFQFNEKWIQCGIEDSDGTTHNSLENFLAFGFGNKIVWNRYTQPKELPLIDDEPSLNDQYAEIEQVRQSAWDKQTGGDHYKKLAIQPMEYALKNKLDYAQANVVKYVTRHADKNGKEDLLKAIHNIELMIEHYYS